MFQMGKRLLTVSLFLTAVGCQSGGSADVDLTLTQTPSPVQAAFMHNHGPAAIQQITRTSKGNQDYYTFRFTDTGGKEKTVQMNEGGDEIASH